MTTIETTAFRTVLENRWAELSRERGLREALTVESTSDDLDLIQEIGNRDIALDRLQRHSSQLQELRAALLRIRTHTFGVCVSCAEAIKPKRLAAVPWASYCIACQEAVDLGHEFSRNSFADLAA